MQNALHSYAPQRFPLSFSSGGSSDRIQCNWDVLRSQLLKQWNSISPWELDAEGPYRRRLALLIERRHGVSARLVENYLRNFERTLPLL